LRLQGQYAAHIHWDSRPAHPDPLRLGPLEACEDPVADEVTFELRDSREDVEQEPPSRRGGVDLLIEHDQIDTQSFELPHQSDQVVDAPGQSVEFHTGHDIDLAGPDCGE